LSASSPSSAANTVSPEEIVRRISAIVSRDQIRMPDGDEAPVAMVIVEPSEIAELTELVHVCERDRISMTPVGATRTLREIRRTPVALGISLTRFNRVVAYEPEDMTVTVEAGMNVGALNRSMETAHQRLPVDPRCPDATTVGALIAASQAGPLRLSEGTVRDLLIGIRYVGHGGQVVHGGGRVVKNVAGYDLMKVMGGSFGTLGIIIEATFKVRPVPEQYAMASLRFDRAEDAFATAGRLNYSFPLAHLEVLSPAPARGCGFAAGFQLLAGISGSRSEITSLRDAIGKLGTTVAFLEGSAARNAYERVRDFDMTGFAIAAQIAVPSAALAPILVASGGDYLAHAGSGVAKLLVNGSPQDARSLLECWREAAREAGGHLRLIHCDPSLRSSIEVFDSPRGGALKLMRRMKSVLDPAGVFNPGCFVGGI
jgi:glycolate oxidase FAD binding subunit